MSAPDHLPKDDRPIAIIVNGRPKHITGSTISFEEVVKLGFPDATFGDASAYTITYSKGKDPKRVGSLVEGQTVPVSSGMIFNVSATNKS